MASMKVQWFAAWKQAWASRGRTQTARSIPDPLEGGYSDFLGPDGLRECFPLGLLQDDGHPRVFCAAWRLRLYGYLDEHSYTALCTGADRLTREQYDDAVDTLNAHCPPYIRIGVHREDEDAFGFWVQWSRLERDYAAGTLQRFVNRVPKECAGLATLIGHAGEQSLLNFDIRGAPDGQPFTVWTVF